jgi:extracellular factor (EF) 3-hydroxypalmitic acid methyl ester biosynthesis protein
MAAFPSSAAEALPDAPRREATLEVGPDAVRATVWAASRLSLAVRPSRPIATPADEVWLSVELPDGPARLGPARLVPGPPDAPLRLVFLENLVDCRVLVRDGRVADLRAWFDNVPVVLAQKERIRPEFREHVSAVAYDLSVWRRFFDEQDRVLAGEPHDVEQVARDALLRTEGRRFMAYLDVKVSELGRIVESYTKEEHERHGFYLRRHLWPYLLASEFMKRTNLKPAGYAGDAELMVMIYEDRYLGASTFNQLMHKHGLETRAAQAVRNRRSMVPRVIREAFTRHGRSGPYRFLSLACGPACELDDVFLEGSDLRRFDVSLLDQDPHALELARGMVRRVEARLGGKLAVRYHEDSVRTMLRSRDLRQRFGEHDLVYSMGLFDYLTAPVARAVLHKTYELLAPGGVLLVGNFHQRSPTRLHMDYLGDWPLVYRTEDSFLALTDGLDAIRGLSFDETGAQMFLRLERPRA